MATKHPKISPVRQSSLPLPIKNFRVRSRRRQSITSTERSMEDVSTQSHNPATSRTLQPKKSRRGSLLQRLWKSSSKLGSFSSSSNTNRTSRNNKLALDSSQTHSMRSSSVEYHDHDDDDDTDQGEECTAGDFTGAGSTSAKHHHYLDLEEDELCVVQGDDYNNGDFDFQEEDVTEQDDDDKETDEEALRLLELGLQERRNNPEAAILTWNLALDVLAHRPHCSLAQTLFRKCIDAYLQVYRTTSDSSQLEAAASLVAQLQCQTKTTTSCDWEESPLLLDLLMQQSCWVIALQVTHKLLSPPQALHVVQPLTLARLHLEVALSNNTQQQYRSSQLKHLSECHQLLLAFDPSDSDDCSGEDKANTQYELLWRELAQAYGLLDEEELALGCSQSRMQHWKSSWEVALGHYDQAVGVYTLARQHALALKETELAMAALERYQKQQESIQNNCGDAEEQQVAMIMKTESLWVKLYQCKADILLRMKRIGDSIDTYKILLEMNHKSAHRGPVDAANVLFSLGKLSVRQKDFEGAVQFFTEELRMTKSVINGGNNNARAITTTTTNDATTTTHHHLAISKILHELARVAELGLMDFTMAIQYYQEALQVERGVYQHLKHQRENQQMISAANATVLKDTKNQIGDTKQCLGRLHFKLGDFNRAVKTTLAVDKL